MWTYAESDPWTAHSGSLEVWRLESLVGGGWAAPENRERRTARAGAKRQTFPGYRAPLRGDGQGVGRMAQGTADSAD